MKPFVLINFKTYKESFGKRALALAKEIAKVKKSRYDIAVAPSLLTLQKIAEQTSLKVFSQHGDNVSFGAHTGSIPVDELVNLGVKGVLLNHSEKKLPADILGRTILLCKNKGLTAVACASSLAEIRKVAEFCPHFIAYEPKELIGGNISVTEAKPEIIVEAVDLVKKTCPKTRLLCGAGVHSKEDLGHALLLGAEGVLMGHAVATAKHPAQFLKEMLM
ncbi:MAG: triose-phosphate isomerase [Nanoarchaeota archaeon]